MDMSILVLDIIVTVGLTITGYYAGQRSEQNKQEAMKFLSRVGKGGKLEEKAEKQHEVWVHWMKYMFTNTFINVHDQTTIRKGSVRKWKKLMEASYGELTEKEKQSDRDIVKKFKL